MKILALALAALMPCLAAGPDADKGRTMGDPAAPMLFELYSDFGCPACKNLHENVLPSIIRDFVVTGKAYLVFREFPLNIPAHVHSRPAAAIAVAAPEEQNKVQALAKDPAVLADVQRDVDRGAKVPINQTPTLLITYKLKQQPWANFTDYSLFRGYIDGLLKR